VTAISMVREAKTANMDERSCNLLLANKLADHVRKYGTADLAR
jgi:hypothetical protein